MKTFFKTILLITLLIFTSCNSDDEDQQGNDKNMIFIDGVTSNTQNAYLIFGNNSANTSGNPANNTFKNSFFLYFSDGSMELGTGGEALISTNTNHFVALQVKNTPQFVANEQQVSILVQTYNLSDDTAVITNIGGYNDLETIMGNSYGNIDLSLGQTIHEIDNTGSGNVTIDSFTIDYALGIGTLKCSYTMIDDNGINIQGKYEGNFKITYRD